jgi:hypothetical protein
MSVATEDASEWRTEARAYGWLLVVGSILATCFAFAHPHLSSRELAPVIRELAAGATFNGWIHGSLIALYLCVATGFVGLTRRLGFERPAATAGLVFYVAGTLAMMGAAVINGFALGLFAGRYSSVTPDKVAALGSSINMAGSISAVWAGIGAVGTSAAILAWSSLLVRRSGGLRVIGGAGILLGLATIAMLVSGTLILDVHGFLLLVVSQALWTVAVGLALAHGQI